MFDVTKLFSPSAIAHAIKHTTPIGTPIADEFYPKAIRTNHHKSVIGVDEITKIVKAVPVVRRGTASISIGGGSRSISYIEPQPIDIHTFAGAKDLNDIQTLDGTGQQVYVNNSISFLRNTILTTVEALSAQSLSGKISFAMKIDGNMDTYEIDYGTIPVYTPAALWTAAESDLETVLEDMMDMAEVVEKNGFGQEVMFYAGKKVFKRIAGLIKALSNDSRIDAKVNGMTITIGDYTVKRMSATYYDPASKTYKPAVADTKMLCKSKNAGFGFKYLAIDSLKNGLKATPMLIDPKLVDDPEGYKIYGKSTPLPIPTVKGMCEGTFAA